MCIDTETQDTEKKKHLVCSRKTHTGRKTGTGAPKMRLERERMRAAINHGNQKSRSDSGAHLKTLQWVGCGLERKKKEKKKKERNFFFSECSHFHWKAKGVGVNTFSLRDCWIRLQAVGSTITRHESQHLCLKKWMLSSIQIKRNNGAESRQWPEIIARFGAISVRPNCNCVTAVWLLRWQLALLTAIKPAP